MVPKLGTAITYNSSGFLKMKFTTFVAWRSWGWLLCGMGLGAARGAEEVDYFADNGFGKPLSTLHHPSGEYYRGSTYVAYQGPHEDAYVCAYNHVSKKWTGPFLAGVSPLGKTPDPTDNAALDNHGKPAMMVDRAGYLHVVFGGHGGNALLGVNALGTPAGPGRGGKLIHMVSRQPEDITAWEVLDNIAPFGTYPQFVQMDGGEIYLFYRHGTHQSDWVYQKSGDQGRRFAAPVSVLKHQLRGAGPVHDAWYAWFGKGLGNSVTAAYSYHPCSYPGHSKARLNVYYMQMQGAEGTWENVLGEKLAVPLTKDVADQKTRIVDSGEDRCNHGTCRVDPAGYPHVLFRYQSGQARYLRWTGRAWTEPVAIISDGEASGQDGDLQVESSTRVRAMLMRTKGGQREVGWWDTVDGGQSWAPEAPLFSRAGGGLDLGALIENGSAEGLVVVSEGRVPEHLYRKMFLLGERGPVRRAAAEASQVGPQLELLRRAGAARPPGEGKRAQPEAEED